MKICLITDQHFGRKNDSPEMLEYFKKFYDEVFFPTLEKLKIKTIINLGDLVERKKFINSYTFHVMNECFLKRVERENYKMYICKGNHDTYFKNTNSVNFLDNILHNYKNITVVDDYEYILDNKFLLCSWITDSNKEKIVKEIYANKAEYLCGHFEFNGFSTGVITMTEGMEPSNLDKYKAVFSGHFHQRQSKDNIHYVGCPYEMDFFDIHQNKGFMILDTETEEYEIIINPNKLYTKFVYTDHNKTLNEICKDFNIFRGKFVEILVKEKTNPELYSLFKDKLFESSPIDFNIKDEVELSKYQISEEEINTNLNMSTIEILNSYLENIEYAYKDELKSFMTKMYIEAVNNANSSED